MAYSVNLNNFNSCNDFVKRRFDEVIVDNKLTLMDIENEEFTNLRPFSTNVTKNNVYYSRFGVVIKNGVGSTNEYSFYGFYGQLPFLVDDNDIRPYYYIDRPPYDNIKGLKFICGVRNDIYNDYIFDTYSYGAVNTENRFLFDETTMAINYYTYGDSRNDTAKAQLLAKAKNERIVNSRASYSGRYNDARHLNTSIDNYNILSTAYGAATWQGLQEHQYATGGNVVRVYIDTNIPIFYIDEPEKISAWVNNGDRSGEVPRALSTTTNFNLWIKGLDAPSYKLNWHNDELESDNFDFSNSDVTISVKRDDLPFYREVFKVPYTDGSIYFTYYDLLDALEHDDSILFPWLDFSATVTYRKDFDDATPYTSGRPSVDLRRKAPNFDSMYKDLVSADDGSSINVINYENDPSGYDSNEDDYHDPSDNTDDTPDPTEELTVVNNLSKCYVIDSLELSKLSSFLWGAGFLDNIKLINNNPIENIVSLKAIIGTVSGGDSQTLTLGNVQTTSNVRKCNETLTIDVGSFTVPKKYNNFLDFAPYTKVQIYLPFFGTTNLDSSLVVGRTINIKYIIDVVTGTAKIKILHDSKTLYEFKCSCGADLPITSSNRASVEMGYISSGIGLVGSIASGNVIGATMSLLNMAQSQFHSQTSGNCNGILNFHDSREVTILVDRPIYTELKNFNATKGRMCNLSLSLKNLNGFTQCDGNVRLNFDMLAEEETMLRDLMSSGIIL